MTPSPCINVCRMDADNRLCLGCFRTLDEIAAWTRLDAAARASVLAAVAQRRAALAADAPVQPAGAAPHG